MNNIYNFIKNIVKAIPVLNTYLSSDIKSNNVQELANTSMKKRSIIWKSSLLLVKNKFYESVTLFKNFYSKIDSDKIINNLLNNNYFYFILAIISISILFLIYYFTGIIYCEGGDTDVTTPSGDGDNTTIPSEDEVKNKSENTKAIILESKEHYHISKEAFDKGVDLFNQSITTVIQSIAPHLGAGTAAAGAVAAVIKNSNLPILPKLALTGATAAIAAGGTRIGLVGADALLRSNASKESIEIVPDTLNEPQSPVNDFIHSVLEKGDMLTPLEELLKCQLGLNVLMLVEIFILIMIIYNKLFINSSFSIFNKYLYPKLGDRFKSFSHKINSFNDRFFYIIFIINCLFLIFAILFSFIIIGSLNTNLQDYIDVYNQIKK